MGKKAGQGDGEFVGVEASKEEIERHNLLHDLKTLQLCVVLTSPSFVVFRQ